MYPDNVLPLQLGMILYYVNKTKNKRPSCNIVFRSRVFSFFDLFRCYY